MPGRIPQAFIDDLIARADIAEIIGTRVPLKKAGREYKACCPFHGEKTPSFWVSPEKQFFHCFGCGKHGTVIGFLMEYDRMSFPEAIEDLAGRLGVEVPREGGADPGPKRVDDGAFELMAKVARYWAENLQRDERVKQYAISKRGLTKETIERFGIGYALNSWNDVLRRFGGSESSVRLLAEMGLVIEREGGQIRDGERHYDRFRDRLMFPIRDARGKTIAFGGRIIDQGEPKYLNSPETALFHKGRELYGLYEMRQSRTPSRRLVVVEGYMDVVRLHQAGIPYAIATLGTATTPEHLNRIFKQVNEVVFSFDGDRAGRGAAWRALQHALSFAQEPREMKFLFLPEGHDPDSLVGEEGREAFEERLASAEPLSEYLVRALSDEVDISHADGRARFAEAARPLVEKLPRGVYFDQVIQRIAHELGRSPEKLEEVWEDSRKRARTPTPPPQQRPAGDEFGRSTGHAAPTSAGRGTLMRQAIDALLRFPSIAQAVTPQQVDSLSQINDRGAELLRELMASLQQHPAQSAGQVIQRFEGRPEQEQLSRLLHKEDLIQSPGQALEEFSSALAKMVSAADQRRFEELSKIAAWGPDAMTEEQRLEFKSLVTRSTLRKPSA